MIYMELVYILLFNFPLFLDSDRMVSHKNMHNIFQVMHLQGTVVYWSNTINCSGYGKVDMDIGIRGLRGGNRRLKGGDGGGGWKLRLTRQDTGSEKYV